MALLLAGTKDATLIPGDPIAYWPAIVITDPMERCALHGTQRIII